MYNFFNPFFIILFFFIIACFVLPWINFFRMNALSKKILHLTQRIKELEEGTTKKKTKAKVVAEPVKSESLPEIIETPVKLEQKKIKAPSPVRSGESIESQLGMRLPVWIGGIALALGGFFLVKWSIDVGLLNPLVRVFLAFILGSSLLLAGQKFIPFSKQEMNLKIAQSLSGAGLATLYGTFYAATTLYDLLPSFLGFIALSLTTGLGILLSLRQGLPIAVLSLLGGFLTPLLVGSEHPSAIILFGYLYILFSAMTVLARSRDWSELVALAGLAAFLWAAFWITVHGYNDHGIILGIFILAVTLSSLYSHDIKFYSENRNKLKIASTISVPLLGILFFTHIATHTQYADLHIWMYVLLTSAGFILTYYSPTLYNYFPLATFLCITPILFNYTPDSHKQYMLIWMTYAVMYIGGFTVLLRKNKIPLWAAAIMISSLAFLGILYRHFEHVALIHLDDFLWGSICLAFAAYAVAIISPLIKSESKSEVILAWLSAMATTFVCLGLAFILSESTFKTALAFEMLALYWLSSQIKLKILRTYGLLVGIGFLIFNFLNLFGACERALLQPLLGQTKGFYAPFYSLGNSLTDNLMTLTLPALAFMASSLFAQSEKESEKNFLKITGLLIFSLGLINMLRIFFINPEHISSLPSIYEGSLILNLYFAIGLCSLYYGTRTKEVAIETFGLTVTYFAIFHIVYTYVLLSNPIITGVEISGLPIFNILMLIYGTPILWTILASYFSKSRQAMTLLGLSLLLTFTFLTMTVRSLYHMPDLSAFTTSTAEIYTYSFAWLIFALCLMFIGVLKQNNMIRYASLTLLLVTIGKVFLYDASTLEGLYRVLSFLGLGVSLIIISYVYAKFIFPPRK